MIKNISDILLPYQKSFMKDKHKRKIWISSRQIGKSFCVASILCYKALSRNNGLSLCISTGQRAAAEIISKCKQFAEAIKILSNGSIDYSASYDQIKFSNGCRILSLPSSTDGSNLRGFTASCVVIDEACYVWHLDKIMQAINPTLSRDPESELILTSTPAGKNGAFYELYLKALNDENWYVQTTDIYQAKQQGLNIDIDSLKTLCPDPDIFKQEYECYFSNEYGAMIDINNLEYYSEDIEKYDGIYFSADIGRTHDKTSIVITKTKNDIIFVDDVIMLDKCDYKSQLDIFKQLNDKYHFNGGYIDQGGIGSAVAEFANRQISIKIKGLSFTGSNKTPMYEAVRDRIFQRKLKFNQKFKDLIDTDFKNVQRIVTETGTIKFTAGRDDNGHSDFVSSLVLNIQAIHDNPVNLKQPISYSKPSMFGVRGSSRLI